MKTIDELQKKCTHNYAKRADYWLKWRCVGCGVLKWYWKFKKIKT